MYNITANGDSKFKTDLKESKGQFSGTLNEALVNGDLLKINEQQFHLLYKGKSFNIEVIRFNAEEKSMLLKVNSKKVSIELKDKYDELLHSLGMDNLASKKVNEIKAPMPGMVLKIMVTEGDTVKKGDPLIVLEAMKMENILKSPAEGIIKKINAIKGTAVEKNQVLIQF